MDATPREPWLTRAERGAQRGWQLLGALLGLGAFAGVGFVAASALNRALPHGPVVEQADHPYAHQTWFPEYRTEFLASLEMRWESYVYWQRRTFAGVYINVDQHGFRRTRQPVPLGPHPRQLWFFGGSTLWGTWQRDSRTIPSLTAAALVDRGIRDVEVRNFGETGYVFTQEVLRLLLQLRAGERPDVVVFYDGANDLASSTMNPACGIPQNEDRRSFEFALGRLLTSWKAREMWSFAALLADRIREQAHEILVGQGKEPPKVLNVPSLAAGVVDCYARTAGLVEALSREYRFRVLYFWQPMPGTSPKPATPFERPALDTVVRNGLREYLPPLDRAAARQIDSAMARVAPGRFTNLTALFTGERGTVWMDFIGHITERANKAVVRSMIEPIARELSLQSAPAGGRGE